MITYAVVAHDAVSLTPASLIEDSDLMSPFCWVEDGLFKMLLRAVPRSGESTGVIWAARSEDGLNFRLEAGPAIEPGPGDEDLKGCEDPTVVRHGGDYTVFYTGVPASGQGQLLQANGADLRSLSKGRALLKAPEGEGHIKEATVARAGDDDWVLWYEYAKGGASRIGCARGPSPTGPWTTACDPFDVRPDSWDCGHLSTGPIEVLPGGDPVMFYNGATMDARWRIGWVTFSRDYREITGRGIEPMLVPVPPADRDGIDIAFAASTVVASDQIHLYYSLSDKTLRRATVQRF